MWKNINLLTSNKNKLILQTIDIPDDTTIKWNDIKKINVGVFKTTDVSIRIDQLVAERKSYHLN